MKTLLLGITITTLAVLATAVVSFIFARMAIIEIHKEYKKILESRDQELLQANQDRSQLSKRVAELEAELTLDRVNEPQVDFFEVPKGKRYVGNH